MRNNVNQTVPTTVSGSASHTILATVALALFGWVGGVLAAPAESGSAHNGLNGGVACYVGAEHAEEALKLARNENWVVHLLDTDRTKVEAMSRQALDAGLIGKNIYVETWNGKTLPHADHLVTTLMAKAGAVTSEEALRVITPIRGVASIGDQTLTKPLPEGSDDWTHRMHGPDNNPVSEDTAFQLPFLHQFVVPPRANSLNGSLVVSNGRRFELTDWGLKKTDRANISGWLTARDAYNGQVLWRRRLPEKIETDRQNSVAVGDRFYLTADDRPAVLVFDAETGNELPETVVSPDPAQRIHWMGIENGRLYALLGPEMEVRGNAFALANQLARFNQAFSGKAVACYDLTQGRLLWTHKEPEGTIDYRTVGVRDGATYFYTENTRLAKLNANGQVEWENRDAWIGDLERNPKHHGANSAGVSTLLIGPTGQLRLSLHAVDDSYIFDTTSGKLLWQVPEGRRTSATKCLLVDGKVVQGSVAFDATSGDVLAEGQEVREGGGCGVISWVPGAAKAIGHLHFGVKSPCGQPIFAAGGMLHQASSFCDCPGPVRGAAALAPGGKVLAQIAATAEHPLETGDAPSPTLKAGSGDWSQFRSNPERQSHATTQVPAQGKIAWISTETNPLLVPEGHNMHRFEWLDRPTPPVTAGGLVFHGGSDGVVKATRISDGSRAWSYATAGPILSSPAFEGGRLFVGSGDGWLYCLDAATGKLAWRYRGAPVERRMMWNGKLSSNWPITSMVLRDGKVYAVAGMLKQSGVHLFSLNAVDGKTVWSQWSEPSFDADEAAEGGEPTEPAAPPAHGYAPSGTMALNGDVLWVRDFMGIPTLFNAATGERILPPRSLEAAVAKHYHRMWMRNPGKDTVVIDADLVLQGGMHLAANPDERRDKSTLGFFAWRVDESGNAPGLPYPFEAPPQGTIPPSLDQSDILMVGGHLPSEKRVTSRNDSLDTLGVSLWSLPVWRQEMEDSTIAESRNKAKGPKKGNEDPYSVSKKWKPIDFAKASWSKPDIDASAVVLGADAALVAHGIAAKQKTKSGLFPPYETWKLSAFDRKTGQERWTVDLPGEPIFDGIAPAADGSWVVALRDGSIACVKQ